jgi:hypothetical protein
MRYKENMGKWLTSEKLEIEYEDDQQHGKDNDTAKHPALLVHPA